MKGIAICIVMVVISAGIHAADPDWKCAARTRSSMERLWVAIEAFAVDNNRYPVYRSTEELSSQLIPRYAVALNFSDGWGRPFRIVIEEQEFTIVSYGADGQPDNRRYAPDGKPLSNTPRQTSSFQDDVVFSANQFLSSHDALLEKHKSEIAVMKRSEPAVMSVEEARASQLENRFDAVAALAKAVAAYQKKAKACPLVTDGSVEKLSQSMGALPVTVDAWNRPLHYYCLQESGPFWVVSYGEDGEPDKGIYDQRGIPVKNQNFLRSAQSDVIYRNDTPASYTLDSWKRLKPMEVVVFLNKDHTIFIGENWVPRAEFIAELKSGIPKEKIRIVSTGAELRFQQQVRKMLEDANLSAMIVDD